MIWTLAFWKGAGERAVKTFAEALIAAIGVNTLAAPSLSQVDWGHDASIAAVATVLSLLTSLGNASFTAGATAQANANEVLSKNLGGTQPGGGVDPVKVLAKQDAVQRFEAASAAVVTDPAPASAPSSYSSLPSAPLAGA